MIRAAIGFFALAIIAYILGLGGVAGLSMEIAKLLLFAFLILAVVSLIIGLISGRGSRPLLK